MRFFRSLLCFLICYTPCAAQLPAAFTVTQYNEANSGISGTVTCFLQAQNGYLWFGSSNGLMRFDSYSFKTYFNHPGFSNTINHLAEDREHNI
jgi:ligand-binding sensor domain-containing protein